MSYIDTRDLIEKRDNLKEQVLEDFNDRFNTELDDFDEIDIYLNDEASENIDKDEREAEIINTKVMLKVKIKDYCKTHKLKFIKYYNNGFLASSKVDVKAGMKKVLGFDKFEHYDIRVIGQKEIIRHYLCYSDLDIVDNGIFNRNVL